VLSNLVPGDSLTLFTAYWRIFFLIEFPSPKESFSFFGKLAFHLSRLPGFMQLSGTGFDLAF
jgi:hypothetical protein